LDYDSPSPARHNLRDITQPDRLRLPYLNPQRLNCSGIQPTARAQVRKFIFQPLQRFLDGGFEGREVKRICGFGGFFWILELLGGPFSVERACRCKCAGGCSWGCSFGLGLETERGIKSSTAMLRLAAFCSITRSHASSRSTYLPPKLPKAPTGFTPPKLRSIGSIARE